MTKEDKKKILSDWKEKNVEFYLALVNSNMVGTYSSGYALVIPIDFCISCDTTKGFSPPSPNSVSQSFEELLNHIFETHFTCNVEGDNR